MLFISHCSEDKTFARDLLRRAVARGYEQRHLFLDSDPDAGIRPGEDWEHAIYEKLKQQRALLVVCSPRWNSSKWCFAELVVAKTLGKPIFPVVVEECALDGVLGERQAVWPCREPEAAFAALWKALADHSLGPHDTRPWPPLGADGKPTDPCPYPGLTAFSERFAPVYIGRDRETAEVQETLNTMRDRGEPRLLLIHGGSGSGKSSLLRAGVLPRLQPHPDWTVLPTLRYSQTPNDDLTLLGMLAQELTARFPAGTPAGPGWQVLRAKFESADVASAARHFFDVTQDLNLALGRRHASTLVAVDQFEELLTGASLPSAEQFLRFLHTLLAGNNGRLLVIGTLRSDYLDLYERQPHALQPPQLQTYRLPPLPWERVTDVIVQPAARVGITFTDELLESLKADAPTSDALPLLAFTLERLFRKRAAAGRIELDDYKTLGGMTGAIEQAVKKIVPDKLPPETERTLRLSFVRHLVQVNEKGEFVRRPARWSDLPARPLLEKFVDERLLHSVGEGEAALVEVAHEALFRCWDRLNAWLRAELNNLRLRRKLETTAKDWHDSRTADRPDGDQDLFFTTGQLEAIDEWKQDAKLESVEELFLKASRQKRADDAQREIERLRRVADAEREKQQAEVRFSQRMKWAVAGITAVALAALVLFLVALNQRSAAVASAKDAERKARIAEANRLVANINALPLGLPQLRTLLAIEAGRSTRHDDEGLLPISHQALWDALVNIGGSPLPGVDQMAFSPDNRSLVTTGDPNPRVWDISARNWTSRDLSGLGKEYIAGLRFSNDGRWLVTSPRRPVPINEILPGGHRVQKMTPAKPSTVWDLRSASLEHGSWSLPPGADPLLSPDSRWLVTVSDGRPVQVHDLYSATPALAKHKLQWADQKYLSQVRFTPDGRWLMVKWKKEKEDLKSHPAGTLWLWSLRSPESVQLKLAGVTEHLVSEDSRWLIVVKEHNTVQVWDLKAPDPTTSARVLPHGEKLVSAVAISPDSRLAVTGGQSGAVHVWELPSLAHRVLVGHKTPIAKAQFISNQKWLLTSESPHSAQGGPSKFVTTYGNRLWNLADKSPQPHLLDGMEHVTTSPDGRLLVNRGGYNRDTKLYVYNLSSDDPTKSKFAIETNDLSVQAILFSADGRRLVTEGTHQSTTIWDLSAEPPSQQSAGGFLALSHDGRWLVTAGEHHEVNLWDLRAPDNHVPPRTLWGDEAEVHSGWISPDCRWLVTKSHLKDVARVWDLKAAGFNPQVQVVSNDEVSCAALSADGRWLVLGSSEVTGRDIKDISDQSYDRVEVTLKRRFFVRVGDLGSRDFVSGSRVLGGHQGWITGIATSADGRWVVSGSDDTTARVWDTQSSENPSNPRVLKGHAKEVKCVAMSADGRWVVTGSEDTTARVWDIWAPQSGANPRVLEGHKEGVASVAVSNDGSWVATGSRDGDARLWNLQAAGLPENPRPLNDTKFPVTAFAFSSDGRALLTAGADGAARLWDLRAASLPPRVLMRQEAGIAGACLSSDQRWLVTRDMDHSIRVWDLSRPYDAASCQFKLEPPTFPDPVAGTQYAFGFEVVPLDRRPEPSMAVSSGADLIVTADATNHLRLWRPQWEGLVAAARGVVARNFTEPEWARYFPGQEYRRTFEGLPAPGHSRTGQMGGQQRVSQRP
jgi:WD40 repeat protein